MHVCKIKSISKMYLESCIKQIYSNLYKKQLIYFLTIKYAIQAR